MHPLYSNFPNISFSNSNAHTIPIQPPLINFFNLVPIKLNESNKRLREELDKDHCTKKTRLEKISERCITQKTSIQSNHDLSYCKIQFALQNYFAQTNTSALGQVSLFHDLKISVSQQIHKLKHHHKTVCPSDLRNFLASGSISYTILTFATMIIDPYVGVVEEMCLVVKDCLDLLPEIYRFQIGHILDLLVKDETFAKNFTHSFSVHKACHKLIFIDTKRSLHNPFIDYFARVNLLAALFFIMGQNTGEGNCYAVAKLNYMMRENPHSCVRIMKEALISGSFTFNNQKLPLTVLLDNKKKDFFPTLPIQQANQLIAVEIANGYISPCEIIDENHSLTLEAFFRKRYGPHYELAQEISGSLKQNYLHGALLQIIDFYGNNTLRDSPHNPFSFVTSRQYFFCLLEHIYKGILGNRFYDLIDLFVQEVDKRFFLIAHRNVNIQQEDQHVYVDNHIKVDFITDIDHYNCFLEIDQLYYYDNNRFYSITRLSELQKIIADLITTTAHNHGYNCESLRNYISSNKVKSALANLCARYNKSKENFPNQFDPTFFYNSDSFLLMHLGGYVINLDDEDRFTRLTKLQGNTLELSIQHLFAEINLYSKKNNLFDKKESFILAHSHGHIFNFLPNYFEHCLNNVNYIKNKIAQRAIKIVNGTPSHEKKIGIIKELYPRECSHLIPLLSKNHPTFVHFVYDVQSLIIKNNRVLNQNFYDFLDTIECTAVNSNLNKILKYLNIDLDEKSIECIRIAIKKKTEYKYFITPTQLSSVLQKALLTIDINHDIPSYRLEYKLRDFFKLPQEIILANLNWSGILKETTTRTYCVARWDYILNRLVLKSRQMHYYSDFFLMNTFHNTNLYLKDL